MTILSCLMLCLALALDAAALCLLADAPSAPQAQGSFLVLHGTAALLASSVLPALLPSPYRGDGWRALLLALPMTLCLPFLGPLGLALALAAGLRRQRGKTGGTGLWRAAPAPVVEAPAGAPAGEGRLMGVLEYAGERGARLDALIATLSLDGRQAAPLLRIGLRDRDDDVRLLAYALLTRKEKALESRIGAALRQLEQSGADTAWALRRALAQDYWEMAALAGAGGAGAFLLSQALAHAQAAADLRPDDAGLQLLLGRILLKSRAPAPAREALLRAAGAGIAASTVAPFLAEAAFARRRYGEIAGLLRFDGADSASPSLAPLVRYWSPDSC